MSSSVDLTISANIPVSQLIECSDMIKAVNPVVSGPSDTGQRVKVDGLLLFGEVGFFDSGEYLFVAILMLDINKHRSCVPSNYKLIDVSDKGSVYELSIELPPHPYLLLDVLDYGKDYPTTRVFLFQRHRKGEGAT